MVRDNSRILAAVVVVFVVAVQTPLHWPLLCTWAATVLADHPRSAAGRESSAAAAVVDGDEDAAAAVAVVGTDAAAVS